MADIPKPGEYGNPIHLFDANHRVPGSYYCKWVEKNGLAVEGWRHKEEGVDLSGRAAVNDGSVMFFEDVLRIGRGDGDE